MDQDSDFVSKYGYMMSIARHKESLLPRQRPPLPLSLSCTVPHSTLKLNLPEGGGLGWFSKV